MKIKIEYKGKICQAVVIDNYKVSISSEDAGCQNLINDKTIELDQCLKCGVWCSEDEELYGDGYCTKCAQICSDCQLYFYYKDMTKKVNGIYLCSKCNGEKNE